MAEAQACVYAAMVLNDAGAAITSDKLAAVLTAAGIETRPTVPVLFANFLAKKSVAELVTASASAAPQAGAAAGAAPAAAAAAPAAKKDDKKAAKKAPEPEPEDDDDMFGGGLF